MACCLTAPNRYVNQCWLIINKAHWHLAEDRSTKTVLDIPHYKVFKNYIFENTVTTARGQKVHQPGAMLESSSVDYIRFVLIPCVCCTIAFVDVDVL